MQFDDERLDEEFPLGDGTADTAAVVRCPYCGETVEIGLDPGSGADAGLRGGLPGVLPALAGVRELRAGRSGAEVTVEAEDE